MTSEPYFILALNATANATAVLLLGFALVAFMRRASASWRSLVWLVVFGTLVLLPSVALVRPLWSWRVPDFSATSPPLLAAQGGNNPFEPRELAEPLSGMSVAEAKGISGVGSSWTGGQCLIVVYLGIAIGLALYRVLGCWQIRGLSKSEVDRKVRSMVEQLSRSHGLRRHIQVYDSSSAAVPMTWGVLRPVLVLPSRSTEWTDEALLAAIRHEFAHIWHWDAAKRWLSIVAASLFWPHPLVWIAARMWKQEQERACDDFVISAGTHAEAYATQLLEAAKSFPSGGFRTAAALVMATPSGLEVRLRSVLSAATRRDTPGLGGRLLAVLVGSFVMGACASIQAQGDDEELAADGRQIVIRTKFIEVNGSQSVDVLKLPVLGHAATGKSELLSQEEMEDLLRNLSEIEGVDLAATPTVTAQPRQRATVEVVREFIYPIEFENSNGVLTPTAFEMMPLGISVEMEPVLRMDGSVRLGALKAVVNQFDGFVDHRVADLTPIGKETWAWDPIEDLPDSLNLSSPRDRRAAILATTSVGDEVQTWMKSRVLEKDEVSLPVFGTREWSGDMTLAPGVWRLCYLKQSLGDPNLRKDQHIWCLVAVEILDAPDPAILKSPVEDKSDSVGIDSKCLSLAAEGVLALKQILGIDSELDAPSLLAILTRPQFETFAGALTEEAGTEVLGAPKILATSGQKASMVFYPMAVSGNGKSLVSTGQVGLNLEVTPTVFDDQSIGLELAPTLTKFRGWKRMGQDEMVSEVTKDDESYEPVFDSTRISPLTTVTVWSTQTVVLSLGKSDGGRTIVCLVTPTCRVGDN